MPTNQDKSRERKEDKDHNKKQSPGTDNPQRKSGSGKDTGESRSGKSR